MEQPKFKGYSRETNSWHYGFGWFKTDFTEDYLKEKGLPQQATLLTENGAIDCDLESMAQLLGDDYDGQEVYSNDVVKSIIPSGNEHYVIHFDGKSVFKRFHFENNGYPGKPYEDTNDTPLYLKESRVVGTVYEKGVPFNKRTKNDRYKKYEVEYRK